MLKKQGKNTKLFLTSALFLSVVVFFSVIFFVKPEVATAAECIVTSAKFALPPGAGEVKDIDAETFFQPDGGTTPVVYIIIQTSDCSGKSVFVTLHNFSADINTQTVKPEQELLVDSSEKITITAAVGESGACGALADPDCQYWIEVEAEAGTYESTDSVLGIDFDSAPGLNGAGMLEFDNGMCDIVSGCTLDWKFINFDPPQPGAPTVEVETTPTIEPDPECIDDLGNQIPECESLLAPLPGISKIDDSVTLGKYVNLIVKLVIGLITLLSVVMIILGGIQYMTTDAFTEKDTAKTRITNALLGLLVALGAYLILYTINPNLLNLSPNIAEVTLNGGPAYLNTDGTYSVEVGGKPITVAGEVIKSGQPWGENNTAQTKYGLVSVRNELLALGAIINKNECQKIGESGCTSLYFSESAGNKILQAVKKIQDESGGKVRITGGSEAWGHKTHHPEKPIIDLGVSATQGINQSDVGKLNTYLGGSSSFPSECTAEAPNSGKSFIVAVLDEDTPECSWNPGPHWHVILK